jgi:hypothetical protein
MVSFVTICCLNCEVRYSGGVRRAWRAREDNYHSEPKFKVNFQFCATLWIGTCSPATGFNLPQDFGFIH